MRLLFVCGALSLPVSVLTVLAPGCGGNEFVAGGDAGPGGTPDTGSADTNVADTSAADTGSADAADAALAADASWCQTDLPAPLFCEDFDEYPTGAAGISALFSSPNWPSFEQNAGTFDFDNVAPPSPPNALEAKGNDDAEVLIVKDFGAPSALVTSLRLGFDLRIDASGSVGVLSAAGFAAIAFGTTLGDGYVALAIGGGPVLEAVWTLPSDAGPLSNSTFKTQNATGTFPTHGQWSGRYSIEIDYTGAGAGKTGCIQVFQGVTPLLSPCMSLPAQFVNPKAVSIAIGDYAGGEGNTGAIDVEFDNVTFDEK